MLFQTGVVVGALVLRRPVQDLRELLDLYLVVELQRLPLIR